ncbi:MAG: DUF302 domain-containing protein [Bdellovibrionales bacterium]|nr:DUF302 domain-containing protein [Bdellovibrionales bacterium]
MKYYINKTLNDSYNVVKEKVMEALKSEGFGVLTNIDIQTTLKNKINVDFYKYEILGACNPQLAYQALQAEDKIGTMLPCNVILQQKETEGPVEVSAVSPVASMQAIENPQLGELAMAVQKKLEDVIAKLN